MRNNVTKTRSLEGRSPSPSSPSAKRVLATFVLIAGVVTTPQSTATAAVKQSSSGICHDQQSSYYERTRNYTGFGTLAACLENGGRLPDGYDGPGVKAGTPAQDAMVQAKIEQRAFSRVYDREDYPHWSDSDGDCQDQRHELLIKASQIPVTFTGPGPGPGHCHVEPGFFAGAA